MEAQTADWKYLSTGEGGGFFHDTQSISHGQDTTTVWAKRIISDKDKVIKIKMHPEIKGIENITHTVCRFEIN